MKPGGQLSGIIKRYRTAHQAKRRKGPLLKPEPGYKRVRLSRAEKLARERAGYLNQLGRSSNGYHVAQAVRYLKGSKQEIVRQAAATAVVRLWKKPIVPPPGITMTAQDKVDSRAKALFAMYSVGSQYQGQYKKLYLAMEKGASFKELKVFVQSRALTVPVRAFKTSLRYRLLSRISELADRGALPFLISVAKGDKSPIMKKQAKYLILKRLAQKHLQRFDRKSLGTKTMRTVVVLIRALAERGETPGTRLDATRLLKSLAS